MKIWLRSFKRSIIDPSKYIQDLAEGQGQLSLSHWFSSIFKHNECMLELLRVVQVQLLDPLRTRWMTGRHVCVQSGLPDGEHAQ